MWHYNKQDQSGEDGSKRSPFLQVDFRLEGSRNSVAAYLNMLETFFELTEVSDPDPAGRGPIRVQGAMRRLHPLRGGEG